MALTNFTTGTVITADWLNEQDEEVQPQGGGGASLPLYNLTGCTASGNGSLAYKQLGKTITGTFSITLTTATVGSCSFTITLPTEIAYPTQDSTFFGMIHVSGFTNAPDMLKMFLSTDGILTFTWYCSNTANKILTVPFIFRIV